MVDVLLGETGRVEGEVDNPLNILLVEDDPKIVPLMMGALRGHNVIVFDNVEQAVAELRRRKISGNPTHCVFTDLGLDDGKGGVDEKGGFKVARAIKEEELGNPMVVLFTSSADFVKNEYSKKQLMEMGIHAVLGKTSIEKDLTDAAEMAGFHKLDQAPRVNKV